MDESTARSTSLRTRLLWFVLLLGWNWVVYVLSDSSDPTEDVEWAYAIPDWLAHGVEYAAGGFLAWGAFLGASRTRAWALAMGFLLVRALLDEWHQSFVPGRDPSGSDVLADVVGAAAGTLVHALWTARTRRAADGPGEHT